MRNSNFSKRKHLRLLVTASCLSLCTTAALAETTTTIAAGDRAHVVRPGADLSSVELSGVDALVDPMAFNLDDFVGFTYAGKPIADLNRVIDQIWTNYTNSVNGGVITFTFLEGKKLIGLYNNPNYGFTAGNGVNGFSAVQRAETRDTIEFWDDLVAPAFVELNGLGADIQFANSADPAQAYAYYPEYGFTNSQGYKFFSDVFVADPELNWSNNWLGFNGYGATTLIHEVGHTLGLSHPGAYNGAGATTYTSQAEYAQDSEQYSIMSYWSPTETGASIVDWSTFLFGNAQTPMLHDIIAIQAAYGADAATRIGDTVYGFNSTADRDVFDFSQNIYPNVAIYDAGGNDTIDLSGFDASVFIDLHDGSFSSGAQAIPSATEISANRADLSVITGLYFGPIGQATVDGVTAGYIARNHNQLYFDTGVLGLEATSRFNLAIAYGTVIENAIGGSQRDLLWGNEGDNVLTGNAGNDVLQGFEGADTYNGGAGADTFAFTIVESGDSVVDFVQGEDKIDLSGTLVGFSFIGNAAFSSTAGELRYDGGVLMGDANGDGSADLSIDLMGAALDAGDLIL